MVFRIFFSVTALMLAACGSAKEDFGSQPPAQERSVEIPAEQRAQVLPNRAFQAVYNSNGSELESSIAGDPASLKAQNAEGDTPLGLALKLGHRVVAERLVRAAPVEDLFHLNRNGESYIYLAALSGFDGIITQIADAYYNSLGTLQGYDFGDLDQPNSAGRRALFVAKDRVVAEALKVQYYRGLLDRPFWKFALASDNQARSFLHAAAEDGRNDIIVWAAEHTCAPGSWESSDSAWFSYPATILNYGWRGLQTHLLGDWDIPSDLVFNRRDEAYMTALHVAVANKRWGSVRALASCRWLDYDLTDAAGDTPLHAFLKSLNPFRRQQDADVHEAFQFLLAQNTTLRLRTPASRVNRVNNHGNSALHLAAKLSDPYFYNQLAAIGDIYKLDAAGNTAESLFANRQAEAAKNDK